MKALKDVRELIQIMNNDEIQTARAYLEAFDSRVKNEPNKTLRLFDILIANREEYTPDELDELADDIEWQLYRKSQRAAFLRLLQRLKNRLRETLIIDVNLLREKAFSNRFVATANVRKQITQAQILQYRGARKQAEELFEDTLRIAGKFELYEEGLIAIRLLLEHKLVQESDKDFSRLLSLNEEFEFARKAVFSSMNSMNTILARVNYGSPDDKLLFHIERVLESTLPELNRSKSSMVGFHYYLIEAQYHQLKGNYTKARRSLQENIKLIETAIEIHGKVRHGTALLNLADNDLFLRQFDRCQQTAQMALENFPPGSYNHSSGIELKFLAQFYSENFVQAQKTLVEIMPDNIHETHNYVTGKRIYFMSAVAILNSDSSSAYKLLGSINPLETDREGWNISIRITRIICCIETNRHDEASSQTEALRVFFNSFGKGIVSERNRGIYKILKTLSNTGYSFQEAYHKTRSVVEQLESVDGRLAWKIKSPELIQFHQWFASKVFRRSYKFDYKQTG